MHFAESCCVVALGIDLQGNKMPLALAEGATENATLVTELLVGLRERVLDVTRPVLACLVRELDKTHPSAAASLREGMSEANPVATTV